MECKYFRMEEFGVSGNGVTDDSAAIAAAVQAAISDRAEKR